MNITHEYLSKGRMKDMKRPIVGLISLIAVLAAAGAIAEEEADPRRGEGRPPHQQRDLEHSRGPAGSSLMHEGLSLARLAGNPEVASELGLTEEQVEKLKTGSYDLKKEEINLRAKQELAAMAQIRLMGEDDVDEKALMKAVEKTGEISTELAKLRVKQLLLVKQTLTKDQLTRMRQMMRQRMQQRSRGTRHEGMRDRGGRRPQDTGDRAGRERPAGRALQPAENNTEED
jgi:Spy/CpxP family protein refolding chaperone